MSTLVLRKEMEKESQGAFVEPLLAKQVRSQRSRQLFNTFSHLVNFKVSQRLGF